MLRADVAALIDHTLLTPEATAADIGGLCTDAVGLGVGTVCVSPCWTAVAVDAVAGTGISVASVVGFPSGAHRADVKADEAVRAVADGASELDMVVNLGVVAAGDWTGVHADVAAVRAAVPTEVVLKVILESALWDLTRLTDLCRVVVEAGADFVKTSTGYHPAGGATTAAVAAMRAAVGPDIGVKASGGIRTAADVVAMVEAGATRIGASRSVDILAGFS